MNVFRTPRLLAGLVGIGALAALAAWPRTTDVDLTRAVRGPMHVTIDEEGETRVRERFVVSAPVAGRLQRIELEPGDPVVRGRTVLARLTPSTAPLLDARSLAELAAAVEAARASVGQTQADRDRAVAVLARARSSLQRQRQLLEAGAIPRDDVEAAETALRNGEETTRAAEFAVARAEQELRLAEARLTPSGAGQGRPIDVLSPVDGVVLRQLRESESVVPAGAALVEIGDPARLEIVADFLSQDAVQIAAGAEVLVEQWGGAESLAARVRRVEPAGFTKVSALGVEEQRVNVIIDLAAPPVEAVLGDGYRAEVRVVLWRSASTLQVPVGAVFRRGEGWAAFVVQDGRARLRPVTIGHRNDRVVEILEGLGEGDEVVLHPPDTLEDGARVRARANQ